MQNYFTLSLLLSTIILVSCRPGDEVEWQTTSLVQWPGKSPYNQIQLQQLVQNFPSSNQLLLKPITSEISDSSALSTLPSTTSSSISSFISYASPLNAVYFPLYPNQFFNNRIVVPQSNLLESTVKNNETEKVKGSEAQILNNSTENVIKSELALKKNEPEANIDNRTSSNEKLVQQNDHKNANFVIDGIVSIPGAHLYQATSFENNKESVTQKPDKIKTENLQLIRDNNAISSINSQKLSSTLRPDQVYNVLYESNSLRNPLQQQRLFSSHNSRIPLNNSFRSRYNNVPFPTTNRYLNNGRQTFRKATIILEPISLVVAGNGGTAIANPISHAIIKKGVPTRIQFRPEAVAIAGANGKAHAQSDLIIDYINRK